MDAVKAFNGELSSLYEQRPPISKAKMTSITRTAIKAIKFYKHVVQSVEKFIQKCKPEYKVPGLYVIDSIVRQSRHQFTPEKDVFAPRFARNIQTTFLHLFNCANEDKGKIVRVLNLWQKNNVFTPEVIQPLLDMASLASKNELVTPSNGVQAKTPPLNQKPTSKPSPVKDPSWLTGESNVVTSTPQPKPVASAGLDPNIVHQLQNLQTLLLEKKLDFSNLTAKKEEPVKFDKKLLDFDYEDEDDEPSPQQVPPPTQNQPSLPTLDSLQQILSNPEVLRQLQNLQQQMSTRQQQAEMEEKMRKLQEMRHQEEEFDKHLAQTLPNLPFAAECDFKPSTTPTQTPNPEPVMIPPPSNSTPVYSTGQQNLPFRPVEPTDQGDYDERRTIRPPSTVDNTGSGQGSGGGSVSGVDCEVIDLVSGDSTGRGSRSPGGSRARESRKREKDRDRDSSPRRSRRSRSRSRRSRRSRSRDRDRSERSERDREAEKERDRERKRRGLPPLKKEHLAVCSTTLWVGHLSKLVQQEELSDTFGEFGEIDNLILIHPRGCAFVCMNRRHDAAKALQQLKHYKLGGKALTLAWAPGKGLKDKEWKEYWQVENGVSYIPWDKLSEETDFARLEDGGVIDEETLPEWLKDYKNMGPKPTADYNTQQNQGSEGGEEETVDMQQPPPPLPSTTTDIPAPPSTLPGFIPLPDAPMGPPPNAQVQGAPPLPPPPMGLLPPPFGMPPNVGLLGPMGPMGPLGMGNVPLGVPPPMMMPPGGMRLGPPFNQVGMSMGDKGKVPPMPGGGDFSHMVNPFGMPLPTMPPGLPPMATNTAGQNKGPSEMEVDELEDTHIETKENIPGMNMMGAFSHPPPGMPFMQPPPPFGPGNNAIPPPNAVPLPTGGPPPTTGPTNGISADTERSQSKEKSPDRRSNDPRDSSRRRERDIDDRNRERDRERERERDRNDRDRGDRDRSDRDRGDRDRGDRDRGDRDRKKDDDRDSKRRRRDSPGRGREGRDREDRRGGAGDRRENWRDRGGKGGNEGNKWEREDDRRDKRNSSPFGHRDGPPFPHEGPPPDQPPVPRSERPALLPRPDGPPLFPIRPPGPQEFGGRGSDFGPPGPDRDEEREFRGPGGPPGDFRVPGGPPPGFHGPPQDFHEGGPGFHGPGEFREGPAEFHERRPDFHDGRPDFHEGRADFHEGHPDFREGHPDFHEGHPGFHEGRPDFHEGRPDFPDFHEGHPDFHGRGGPEYHGPPEFMRGGPPGPDFQGRGGFFGPRGMRGMPNQGRPPLLRSPNGPPMFGPRGPGPMGMRGPPRGPAGGPMEAPNFMGPPPNHGGAPLRGFQGMRLRGSRFPVLPPPPGGRQWDEFPRQPGPPGGPPSPMGEMPHPLGPPSPMGEVPHPPPGATSPMGGEVQRVPRPPREERKSRWGNFEDREDEGSRDMDTGEEEHITQDKEKKQINSETPEVKVGDDKEEKPLSAILEDNFEPTEKEIPLSALLEEKCMPSKEEKPLSSDLEDNAKPTIEDKPDKSSTPEDNPEPTKQDMPLSALLEEKISVPSDSKPLSEILEKAIPEKEDVKPLSAILEESSQPSGGDFDMFEPCPETQEAVREEPKLELDQIVNAPSLMDDLPPPSEEMSQDDRAPAKEIPAEAAAPVADPLFPPDLPPPKEDTRFKDDVLPIEETSIREEQPEEMAIFRFDSSKIDKMEDMPCNPSPPTSPSQHVELAINPEPPECPEPTPTPDNAE